MDAVRDDPRARVSSSCGPEAAQRNTRISRSVEELVMSLFEALRIEGHIRGACLHSRSGTAFFCKQLLVRGLVLFLVREHSHVLEQQMSSASVAERAPLLQDSASLTCMNSTS